MIEVKNITKNFNGAPVLKNLSFSIESGKVLGLLGLSGSGKTTALKIICGLHQPQSGEIFLNKEKVSLKNLTQLRKQIGYVIQDGGLFPHLTAKQNIELVANEAKMPIKEFNQRLEELLVLCKFSPSLIGKYPKNLSGGQRQRVGIMRALLLKPKILLLDEPMGALDPITRFSMQNELKDLFTKVGCSVLLVTHDLNEAGYLCDEIILLNAGVIEQQGTMNELLANPLSDFVSTFTRSQRPLQ